MSQWAALEGYGAREGLEVSVQRINGKALETFWLLAIMNGASTFGRLTMAAFSDKVGQLNMHIVGQILSSLLILTLWTLSKTIDAAIAFCILFGVTSGAVIGLPPASMANILAGTYMREEDHDVRYKKLGHWTGMMYTMAAVPALAGPTIAGYLVTKYDNNYITIQMWAGANLMISAAFMLLTRWHLPCADGAYVRVKLTRLLGRQRELNEKQKPDDFQGHLVLSPSTLASRHLSGLTTDTSGTMQSPPPTVTAPERMV